MSKSSLSRKKSASRHKSNGHAKSPLAKILDLGKVAAMEVGWGNLADALLESPQWRWQFKYVLGALRKPNLKLSPVQQLAYLSANAFFAGVATRDAINNLGRDPRLDREYRRLNRRYFQSELPDDAEVIWHFGMTLLGWDMRCNGVFEPPALIALSPSLKPRSPEFTKTLLHEMVHLKLHSAGHLMAGDDGHGEDFQRERQRLLSLGAPKFL